MKKKTHAMTQKIERKQDEMIERRSISSGLRHSWRLWRYCCCRYGWYPLLVAPIVTVGCLLSLYSAAGCDFIRVDVGFTPSNPGWNQSQLELGLFLYQSDEVDTNKYRAAFIDGCRSYTDDFFAEFVENDRTWRVAQIMAYVAAGGGVVATISTWLFVVSPLPARFFWPVVVLPALVASFLAEASKFLFYDTSICQKAVWLPQGAESLPRTVQCSLGTSSIYGIAAGSVFLVCLVLVCLKAPNRRELEPNYGLDVEKGNNVVETANLKRFTQRSSFESETDRDPHLPIRRLPVDEPSYYHGDEDSKSGVTTMYSRGNESGYDSSIMTKSAQTGSRHDDDDNYIPEDRPTSYQTIDGNTGEIQNQLSLPAKDVTIVRNKTGDSTYTVSKSRLETVKRMEKDANNISHDSAQIINQFLNDLDESFQVESSSNGK